MEVCAEDIQDVEVSQIGDSTERERGLCYVLRDTFLVFVHNFTMLDAQAT